jgi:hypothetical protein
VIQNLKGARPADVAGWEGPTEEPRGLRIIARTPGGPFPGITWRLIFDAEGRIAQILESRLRTAPSKPGPLRLTEVITAAINGAMDNGTPTVLGYVNEEGQPRLSFRGTTQAYSADQLAVWARYEDAGLPTAIQKNPHACRWCSTHRAAAISSSKAGRISTTTPPCARTCSTTHRWLSSRRIPNATVWRSLSTSRR